jgi:uncharacterized membrane protein (DUF106 family)
LFEELLLGFNPAVSVLIAGTIVLFIINIFYRILIDQKAAKSIKERTKEINKEIKEAQKAGNMDKSKQLLNDLFAENNRLMKMTMRPMIVSFVIVILLLPILSGLYGDKFADIKDNAGSVYLFGKNETFTVQNGTVSVSNGVRFSDRCDGGDCYQIGSFKYEVSEQNGKVKFAPIVVMLPFEIPFIGNNLGWLGWYIITSIPLAFVMRKLMKIHV